MLTISELKERDVVNILDGRRLGFVEDIEIDLNEGRVTAIVVPGRRRFLGLFGRTHDYVIPWEKIKKIGTDVILVELSTFAE